MKALLIIDLQNDFLENGSLSVHQGNEIIPLINSIQERFDLVVATQDWHPEGHKSFAPSHIGKNVFDTIDLNGHLQVLWPNHCVQGSFGAEFSKELNQNKIEMIIRKGTDLNIDSYSAFFDNNKEKETGLNGYLKNRGISSIYICGLAADFCVYFSAKDALELGYETHIISNATKAIDFNNFEKLKHDFTSKGGNIVQL